MRALDLFCGAGGVCKGLQRAGFDVTGIDNQPQPRYPGRFILGDAMRPPVRLADFDFVWASPPCQNYVQWNGINAARGRRREHPDLIPPVLEMLRGTVHVLENVVGAPLPAATLLCGSMFGLGVRRHRLFQGSFVILAPGKCRHTREAVAVYGKLDGRRIWTRADGTEARAAKTLEEARAAMGIDWMTWDEIREAIPPAYAEFIGRQAMIALGA